MPPWRQFERSGSEVQDVHLYSVQCSEFSDNSKTSSVDTRHSAPDYHCLSDEDESFRKVCYTPQCIKSKHPCSTSSTENEGLSSKRLQINRSGSCDGMAESAWPAMPRAPKRHQEAHSRALPRARDACIHMDCDQLTCQFGSIHLPLSNDVIHHDKHVRDFQHPSDDEWTRDVVLSASEEEHSDGITGNCFANNPLMSGLIPHMLDQADHDPFDDFCSSTASTATGGISNFDLSSLQERWNVDKDVAAYLSTVLAFSGATNEEDLIGLTQKKYQDIKMVDPLLAYDSELELRHIRRRNVARLSSTGMSLYHLDTEADEAMQWPKRYTNYQRRVDQQISNERLLISKDAVELLKSISQSESLRTGDVEVTYLHDDKSNTNLTKRQHQRAVTPPLLPISPPLGPLCLPSIIEHVDLTSSPEPLIAIEAAELDRRIMARDDHNIDRADDRAGTSSLALDHIRCFSNIDSSCDVVFSPPHGSGLRDYKADVPLLPLSAYNSSPSTVHTLSLPAALMSLVPVAESDTPPQAAENPNEDVDRFMSKVVRPLAEPAIVQIEKERLIELDTTMRVDVPNVYTSPLKPPWITFVELDTPTSMLNAQRTLLRLLRKDCMQDVRKWSGISKLDKVLPWCAFPIRMARFDVDEVFDDGSANRYVDDLIADIALDVKLFIPSIERLHLLDETTLDDYELGCADFCDEDNSPPEPVSGPNPTVSQYGQEQYQPQVSHYFPITHKSASSAHPCQRHPPLSPQPVLGPKTRTLPPRASLELSKSVHEAPGSSACGNENTSADETNTNPSIQPSMRTLLAKRKRELEAFQPIKISNFDLARPTLDAPSPGSMRLLHDRSTGSALANFIHVQGGQTDFPTEEPRQDIRTASATDPIVTHSTPTDRLPESIRAPLPTPGVIKSSLSGQIVFSPQMFVDRAIVRGMQTLLPNVEPIERSSLAMDNAGHSTVQPVIQHTDADMTLSPSTGLILTTLQILKQKPLPGQTFFHGIREQVSSVAGRYETLIVLVQDVRPVPALDDNDTDALCDFIDFTLSLTTAVQVLYVADSPQEWLAGVISQHIIPTTPEAKLLSDETTWERFLREAGMNAFAAQVVLNQLKRPDVLGSGSDDSDKDASGALYGLAAFLRMSVAARTERFGVMLGGQRVLAQVSAVVDGQWMG